jgi:hypothetical protein
VAWYLWILIGVILGAAGCGLGIWRFEGREVARKSITGDLWGEFMAGRASRTAMGGRSAERPSEAVMGEWTEARRAGWLSKDTEIQFSTDVR